MKTTSACARPRWARAAFSPGQELATTFSFLRPNDLVWNYVVKNYLKGESHRPLTSCTGTRTATNLPGPFFTWYLRNTYLENNLIKPTRSASQGKDRPAKGEASVYAMGAREDHIVPWEAAWSSATQFGPRPGLCWVPVATWRAASTPLRRTSGLTGLRKALGSRLTTGSHGPKKCQAVGGTTGRHGSPSTRGLRWPAEKGG